MSEPSSVWIKPKPLSPTSFLIVPVATCPPRARHVVRLFAQNVRRSCGGGSVGHRLRVLSRAQGCALAAPSPLHARSLHHSATRAQGAGALRSKTGGGSYATRSPVPPAASLARPPASFRPQPVRPDGLRARSDFEMKPRTRTFLVRTHAVL